VDRNRELLEVARRVSRELGLSGVATFKEGDVRPFPCPDEYADRVVCQALLWLMTEGDRIKVLKEMIRVCKKGGLVAAVEGALDTAVTYFPDDLQFTSLYRNRNRAESKGYQRKYGYDRNIGYKLPGIFKRLGLTRVRLDGVTDIRMNADDRLPIGYLVEEHERMLRYAKRLVSKVQKMSTDDERRGSLRRPSRY